MITLFGKTLCESCFSENTEDPCGKCGFSASKYQPDSTALPIGQKLQERYLIGGVIGKGGFGITYTAFDTKLERRVAIKEYYPYGLALRSPGTTMVSAPDADSSDVFGKGAEKFYDEARLVAKFSDNQNIVSIYDFFYENSTVYYVMEYLHGQSMKKYIEKHGVVSPEQAVYIAKEVSNALVSSHSANVLHRDISPDNIMLCNNGKVKLIDFGAARQVLSEGSQSLSVILKQGFAPLEQYQKKGKQGPWTDIYALGATIYYLTTGDVLDDPMSRLDDDEEFSSNIYGINDELWDVIKKSTMLKPKDRYKDIFEFREALNKIAVGSVPLTATYDNSVEVLNFITETPSISATAPAKEAAPVGATMPVKEAAPVGATMPVKEAAPVGATMPVKEAAPIGATMPVKEVAPVGATMPVKEAKPIGATMPVKEAKPISTTMPVREQTPPKKSGVSTILRDTAETSESAAAIAETLEKKKKKKRLIIAAGIVVAVILFLIYSYYSYVSSRIDLGGSWAEWDGTDRSVIAIDVKVTDLSSLVKKAKKKSDVTVYLSGCTFSDPSILEELEDIDNLHSLTLRNCGLSDISALEGVTKLTELALNDNNISDISALKNMTKLTKLSLDGNNISDISALKNLTNLKDLSLTYNGKFYWLESAEEIKDFINKNVKATDNKNSAEAEQQKPEQKKPEETEPEKTEPQKPAEPEPPKTEPQKPAETEPQKPEQQKPEETKPEKTEPQKPAETEPKKPEQQKPGETEPQKPEQQKPEDTEVKIGGDFYSIDSTALDLSNRKLTDAQIANLKHMKNLTSLNISDNNITDLSCLKGLNNLEYIFFNNNSVSDISFMSNMKHLKKISAENNKVRDISVLDGMTELEEVFFGNNYVVDISPLSSSKGLVMVGFNESQIGDISALSGMKELEMVCLAGCGLYDIEPLKDSDKLKFVYLGRNNLSDLSPLKGCTIKELYVDNNRLSGHTDSFAGITINGFAAVDGNNFSKDEINNICSIMTGDFTVYY